MTLLQLSSLLPYLQCFFVKLFPHHLQQQALFRAMQVKADAVSITLLSTDNGSYLSIYLQKEINHEHFEWDLQHLLNDANFSQQPTH